MHGSAAMRDGAAKSNPLREADKAHHLHPFTDPKHVAEFGAHIIAHADGVHITDEFGNRLLDAMAGLGGVNIGYGRAEMAETAAHAMQELAYYHSFSAATHPAAARLAEKLIALAGPAFDRVFFSNSGSEANETIAKIIRHYWRRKGRPEKRFFIARDMAYHGSTWLTASLSGLPHMHAAFGLPEGDIRHIEAPFWYRNGGDLAPDEYGLVAARALEEAIADIGADNIAAFFGEPVQATAGAIIPPATYWPEIQRICRANDILIVADEVVTGFGRTGHWFAHPAFGFEADFMTLAKGLSSTYQPIAASLVSAEVADAIAEGGAFQHGFTTSAHPVAAAVALRNIEIIEQEGLVRRTADELGPMLADALEELTDLPLVGEVRSMGAIAGIELAKDKAKRMQYPLELGVCGQVAGQTLMRGVIVRPTGNALVMCPPLTFEAEHVETLKAALAEALIVVAGQLGL